MTEAEIANALQQRLAGLAGLPAVVWENEAADPTLPYLIAEVVRGGAVDPTLAGGARRHRGYLMVTVVTALDSFATPALVIAEAVCAGFPFGLTLYPGAAGRLVIRQPPEVLQGYRDGTAWRTPVRIPYTAG